MATLTPLVGPTCQSFLSPSPFFFLPRSRRHRPAPGLPALAAGPPRDAPPRRAESAYPPPPPTRARMPPSPPPRHRRHLLAHAGPPRHRRHLLTRAGEEATPPVAGRDGRTGEHGARPGEQPPDPASRWKKTESGRTCVCVSATCTNPRERLRPSFFGGGFQPASSRYIPQRSNPTHLQPPSKHLETGSNLTPQLNIRFRFMADLPFDWILKLLDIKIWRHI